MARIAAFRALRFDQARFADFAPLLAPPYDVINEAQRKELEARHPRNIVHLDLPRGAGDARYDNARTQLDAWLAEGTLRQDAKPALYRYEQTFTFTGAAGPQKYTRKGFISLIELSPFSARIVLPHEHTLSGPKVDRFKLIRATRAHFSQVFSLYRDPAGTIEAVLDAACVAAPDVDATTPDGCRHRLWVVTDETVIAAVARGLYPRSVMIADGHHRYETMVSIRDDMRPADVPMGRSLADWGVMFFARAEDPGLLVLPTHRMVHGLSAQVLSSLPESCRPWFEVVSGTEEDAVAIEERLLREGANAVTFALRRAGARGTTWLKLRADADLARLGPPTLARLDVSVLHGLVLEPLLGIGSEALAKQSNLTYSHDLRETLGRVAASEVQAAFLMNPTKVDQVLDACEAGFVLPQKSTYFQPKLATGLVMARIDPGEEPVLPKA
ncbi:MAG TPA: DUF1015 domain-containing protein [Polyangia bacterium]|jgi:Uncharacterized conserved protein|nr:DUF1015 domain-containing protein [Polyangia bacterium]